MTTFPFSNVTATVGAHNLGPANVSDSEVSLSLVIDRTVTGGLNSLTSVTVLAVEMMQSNDGGVTWKNVAGFSTAGGVINGKNGLPVTQNTMVTTLDPGTSRKLRMTVTISGPSSVVLSGSFTTA